MQRQEKGIKYTNDRKMHKYKNVNFVKVLATVRIDKQVLNWIHEMK